MRHSSATDFLLKIDTLRAKGIKVKSPFRSRRVRPCPSHKNLQIRIVLLHIEGLKKDSLKAVYLLYLKDSSLY